MQQTVQTAEARISELEVEVEAAELQTSKDAEIPVVVDGNNIEASTVKDTAVSNLKYVEAPNSTLDSEVVVMLGDLEPSLNKIAARLEMEGSVTEGSALAMAVNAFKSHDTNGLERTAAIISDVSEQLLRNRKTPQAADVARVLTQIQKGVVAHRCHLQMLVNQSIDEAILQATVVLLEVCAKTHSPEGITTMLNDFHAQLQESVRVDGKWKLEVLISFAASAERLVKALKEAAYQNDALTLTPVLWVLQSCLARFEEVSEPDEGRFDAASAAQLSLREVNTGYISHAVSEIADQALDLCCVELETLCHDNSSQLSAGGYNCFALLLLVASSIASHKQQLSSQVNFMSMKSCEQFEVQLFEVAVRVAEILMAVVSKKQGKMDRTAAELQTQQFALEAELFDANHKLSKSAQELVSASHKMQDALRLQDFKDKQLADLRAAQVEHDQEMTILRFELQALRTFS